MYTIDNFDLAKEEIGKRREAAITLAEARASEVHSKHDDIDKIDRELRASGPLIFKTACEGGDIEPIKARNANLRLQKSELLKKYGYAEDYTDPQYTCKKCSDTGYKKDKFCTCLRELVIEKNIASSGMGRLIKKQTFDNFDLSCYEKDEQGVDIAKHYFNTAKKFADDFGTHSINLLIMGNCGSGKTHLSSSIAGVVLRRGFCVVYESAQNIVNDFEADKFRAGFRNEEPKSDKYLDCELLIIDDLGAEFQTQFSISALYTLINTRINKGLNTIISTNLNDKQLSGTYDGRIYSRLCGEDFFRLTFNTFDHRVEQ